jgi:hypothetical protein
MGRSGNFGKFTNAFRKCGIKPYNPDTLADHDRVLYVKDEDTVRFAEEILDIFASMSTAMFTGKLSPI